MFAGAEAGADIVDGAIDSMSGLSSQPCLGALVAALGDKNNVDLDALSVLNEYWEVSHATYHSLKSMYYLLCMYSKLSLSFLLLLIERKAPIQSL